MPAQLIQFFEFGGQDSRSNPIGFPANRSLRCKNWIKDRSGVLKLRYGYTVPTMSTVSTGSPIHSAYFYEQYDGTKAIIFAQTSILKSMSIGSTGTVSTFPTYLTGSGKISSFFANNYIYLANGTDFKFYDGATMRYVGVSAPTAAEIGSAVHDSVVLTAAETVVGETLSSPPVVAGSVSLWTYIDAGSHIVGHQVGLDDGAGNITGTNISSGTINYSTGALSVTFSTAPGAGTLTTYYTANSVVVAESTASPGSWSGTTLSGYQFYLSYYNPTTQEVSNRISIGSRLPVAGTQSVVVLTRLPATSGEVVKLIGRTADGGQVPYALVDPAGDWVVVDTNDSTATFTNPTVDYNSELPTRNDHPPSTPAAFAKVCYASGRAYAIDVADAHKIRYSESDNDQITPYFVGVPVSCWPSDNAVYFPTGEACDAVHDYKGDTWVWAGEHLGILTEANNYSPNGLPYPDWAGVYVGGISGQRGFVNTAHGPFWLSNKKQLLTMTAEGPGVVSGEYEAGLLTKISDGNLADAELSYFRDTSKGIDRIYILGLDSTNAPIIVVHDFAHRDAQSPYGQGLEFAYTGATLSTFVRNPQSVISLTDSSGAEKIWAGDSAGAFLQLEDGLDDNGAVYTGDYIGLLDFGPDRPQIGGVRWHGDAKIKVSYTTVLNWTLTQLSTQPTQAVQHRDDNEFLYRAPIESNGKFLIYRLQLDSHASGSDTLDLNDPPHLPLEDYGRIYVMEPEIGAGRNLGVRP